MKSVWLTEGYSLICQVGWKDDAINIPFCKNINKMSLKPFKLPVRTKTTRLQQNIGKLR